MWQIHCSNYLRSRGGKKRPEINLLLFVFKTARFNANINKSMTLRFETLVMPSERLVPQNCVIFYWHKKGRTVKTFFFLAKIAFLDDMSYIQVFCSLFKIKEYQISILLIILLNDKFPETHILNENIYFHLHMIKMSIVHLSIFCMTSRYLWFSRFDSVECKRR